MKTHKLLFVLFLLLCMNAFAQTDSNDPVEQVIMVSLRTGSFSEKYSATFDIDKVKTVNSLNKKDLEKKFEKVDSLTNVLNFVLQDGYSLFQTIPITGGSGLGNSQGTAGYLFIFKKTVPKSEMK